MKRWMLAAVTSPAAVLAVIFSAFLVGRLIIVLGGEVFTSHDSAVYAYRGDPARDHGPLVSFTGHAPRPWGVPLFTSLFPNDPARAVGQWALGTFAWALLAWALAQHLRSLPARALAVAGVLGMGLLSTVASWDFAILSESLSLSLGALTVGLLLLWWRIRSPLILAATTATAVWWTFVRPDIRVFTVVLIAVLAFAAWRFIRIGRADDAAAHRRRGQAAAVAGGVLVLAIAWYAAITPTMNETFKPYSGTAMKNDPLPNDEELFVYRLRADVSTDPELKRTFQTKLGMPACPGTDAFDGRAKWDTVAFAEEYVRCPELRAWGIRHKNSFWSSLLFAAPDQFVRKFLRNTSQVFGGEIYAKTPQVVPAPIEWAVFPSRRYGLPVALIGFGVALAAALASGARRRHPLLLTTGVVLGVTSLGSAAATVLMASGEYRRFGLQETVAIRLAMIIFVACAVDAWVRRRARAATATDAAAAPSTAASDRYVGAD